ncbi:MAG: hypothetical protein PQJ45_03795 [Sphaerochaetaceae bacterium]|nr:hypothetical protein [Sphaerochaetaceae bacterium]
MKRNNSQINDKKKIVLYIIISFVILTIIELLIFLPKVRQAIVDSNAIELVNQAMLNSEQSNYRDYTLFFVSMDNNIISFKYTGSNRSDFVHDSFEYQLLSPPLIALKKYCVSFIPNETQLIGVTSKEKATYVNVSKEILNSDNFSLCYQQLKAQALSINSEAKFFLLIEGNLYNQDKELIKKYN